MEELAKEFFRHLFISVRLNEYIKYFAVLIHCAPHIMKFAVNWQVYFVQVPMIFRSCCSWSLPFGVSSPQISRPSNVSFHKWESHHVPPWFLQHLDSSMNNGSTITRNGWQFQPENDDDDRGTLKISYRIVHYRFNLTVPEQKLSDKFGWAKLPRTSCSVNVKINSCINSSVKS